MLPTYTWCVVAYMTGTLCVCFIWLGWKGESHGYNSWWYRQREDNSKVSITLEFCLLFLLYWLLYYRKYRIRLWNSVNFWVVFFLPIQSKFITMKFIVYNVPGFLPPILTASIRQNAFPGLIVEANWRWWCRYPPFWQVVFLFSFLVVYISQNI